MTRYPVGRQYSGQRSRPLWKRINAVKPRETMWRLYSMGCTLQNKEWVLLRRLEAAEKAMRPSR